METVNVSSKGNENKTTLKTFNFLKLNNLNQLSILHPLRLSKGGLLFMDDLVRALMFLWDKCEQE